jgi:L-ascorbate metabolism protein UlaG (beta-lactamase superfamily)
MFEIEYKGGNAVIISTKKSKIVIDPKLSVVGLKDLSAKDAIELATEERLAVYDTDATLVIDSPGEYGIGGFDIKGIAAQRHLDAENLPFASTIYRIETGETRIGVIGNIYVNLSDEQLEELGLLDILIIPVGGNGYTLDAADAAKLIRKIDPKIVIPVHYADKALKYEVPQDDLSGLISELGIPVEVMQKYKQKQSPVAPTSMSMVQLERC